MAAETELMESIPVEIRPGETSVLTLTALEPAAEARARGAPMATPTPPLLVLHVFDANDEPLALKTKVVIHSVRPGSEIAQSTSLDDGVATFGPGSVPRGTYTVLVDPIAGLLEMLGRASTGTPDEWVELDRLGRATAEVLTGEVLGKGDWTASLTALRENGYRFMPGQTWASLESDWTKAERHFDEALLSLVPAQDRETIRLRALATRQYTRAYLPQPLFDPYYMMFAKSSRVRGRAIGFTDASARHLAVRIDTTPFGPHLKTHETMLHEMVHATCGENALEGFQGPIAATDPIDAGLLAFEEGLVAHLTVEMLQVETMSYFTYQGWVRALLRALDLVDAKAIIGRCLQGHQMVDVVRDLYGRLGRDYDTDLKTHGETYIESRNAR